MAASPFGLGAVVGLNIVDDIGKYQDPSGVVYLYRKALLDMMQEFRRSDTDIKKWEVLKKYDIYSFRDNCDHVFVHVVKKIANGSYQIRRQCACCHLTSRYSIPQKLFKGKNALLLYWQSPVKINTFLRSFITQFDYYDYISHNFGDWQEKRQKVIDRDKKTCVRCRRAEGREVHHKNYNRVYFEDLEDLELLCTRCHKIHHKIYNAEDFEE